MTAIQSIVSQAGITGLLSGMVEKYLPVQKGEIQLREVRTSWAEFRNGSPLSGKLEIWDVSNVSG